MEAKRLSETAQLPKRSKQLNAGFALAAAQPATIPARGKGVVKTGLSIAIPEDSYARVAPLSHIATDRMIEAGAGVVDYDYRGEVGVVLFNHGPEDFSVAVGDEVAQLILEKICMAECREVESLEETARGSGGFGSTGVSEEAAEKRRRVESSLVKSGSEAKTLATQEMLVKRIKPTAALPCRGSAAAAGFDLAAAEATKIPAGGKGVVKTGLCISIPEGTYARVAPRSGLAVKKMLHTGAGVVDYDYRGEVGVVLFNHGAEDFSVEVGDRVAQLILEQIFVVNCTEVQSLTETARGAGGFGSTGVSQAVPKQESVGPSLTAEQVTQAGA